MFAIATTQPKLQMATETIASYSLRLTSSTLLEDRRAAILGLRSFAKDLPASVASDSLRALIQTLRKDGEDVDTVKLVLETLLMLFNPNANSPEASEEIALWLADEFTQRQDNITLLLDFLETEDFYSRLYSLQLLSAILASRTERTEECIFTAPLGISRLVAILDDRREQIRNEGLSLLTYLTPNSSEIQKLVAFENAFDRIFNIIKIEGYLSEGDRVVEDCLILLANLLRLNASNQSFFREAGSVPKIGHLLNDALSQNDDSGVADWAKVQRNRNIYALLAVIRLFLVTGGVGTQANQASFSQHGILRQVLQLAFSRSIEVQIKAEALATCADLIRGNPKIQEAFAQEQVTSVLDEPPAEGNSTPRSYSQQNGVPKVYVIDGLLDLTLSVPTPSAFESRLAACECLKAYFFGHPRIRKHFLQRAKEGHDSGADETANVLTTVLQPLDAHAGDPYRYWFAAVILFHLIFEDSVAKSLAMSVTEGDASSGEEVVTCIQTITANLITGIQQDMDKRILVAYLMLLCGWLFEDPEAVNDFLAEGSNIQSLVQTVLRDNSIIVQGLCGCLLGIVYEFSTKDSPIPRATLHPILLSMGRDQYIDRLTKLRNHPLLRDFDVLPQRLPDVFFDKSFADFLKDNFSRIMRAVDRDPGFEVPVGIPEGISRDMVDSLKSQLEALRLQLEERDRQLGHEQADHRKDKDTFAIEISRIKNVNDALQKHHEEDVNKLRSERSRLVQDHQRQLEHIQKISEAKSQDHQRQLEHAQKTSEAKLQDHQRQLEHVQKTSEANSERMRKRMEAEILELQGRLSKMEAQLSKANKNHIQDLQTAHEEYMVKGNELSERLKRAEEKAKDLESRCKEFEARSDAANERVIKVEGLLAQKEGERKAVQEELDDLLMVIGDLEEKAAKYKKQVVTLGGAVSDGDDDDDDDEDEDEGDEAEPGEEGDDVD